MGLSSSSEAQRLQAEVDKYKPRQSELINSKTAGLVLQVLPLVPSLVLTSRAAEREPQHPTGQG